MTPVKAERVRMRFRRRTPVQLVFMTLIVACHAEEFTISDGYYTPDETVLNADCYDRVWDFNRDVTVAADDSTVFGIAVWDDNSGEFPGTLDFYPCSLEGMNFKCTCDHATFPRPSTCDDLEAEQVDLFTAEGTWTSSTAFDVTFTYRRAIVWEDGTETTCPDVCTSVWDLSEVLDTPL